MNENVYKIGRCQDISKRLSQYPKGSQLMYCKTTTDQVLAEDIIIKTFEAHFVCRREFGYEYFEGDVQEMIQQFDNLLNPFV